MILRRQLVYFAALPLLLAAGLAVAMPPFGRGSDFLEHLSIGCIVGTMFGVTTIAAAWTAIGPGWLILRLPASLAVTGTMLAAMQFNVWFWNKPEEIVGMMAISLAAQWLLCQIPLWSMSLGFGLSLRRRDDPPPARVRRQFGIGQLMIFTAIVGVLLGLGRILIATVSLSFLKNNEVVIFLFLVVAAVVMTLPLVFAAFVSRRTWLAVTGSLAFIGLVTLVEWPLCASTVGQRGGPDLAHILWINGFSSGWVLAFVGVVRGFGYQFQHETSAGCVAAKETAR